VVSKKLPADAVQNLDARFGYFQKPYPTQQANGLTHSIDAFNLATFQTIDPLYLAFQTRFAFNVTDQWRENQVFRQTKQRPTEPSSDFIQRVEAQGVRIKTTAADVRDTILQGLLPAILNIGMQH